MRTLTASATNLLPFLEESMSEWKEDADIHVFMAALDPFSDHSYSQERFSEMEMEMRKYAVSFTKNILEASGAISCIDFYQDKIFGKVAKYVIAFEYCILMLLSDAGFYSLAHVLELESDLECSLLLASNFYYKQATSILRNILEQAFLPIHFCDNVSDFDAWKANNFRTPNLRGSNGLINRLLRKSILPSALATRVADLYGKLSAYVHGSEQTLIHQNVHLGEHHRVEYNQKRFLEWCQLFCECIDICIHLLKINYDQWYSIRALKFEMLAKVGKTFCHTCHNEDAFERWLLPAKYCFIFKKRENKEKQVLGDTKGISFYYYICKKCGHTIIVNASETSLDMVVCFSNDGIPSGSEIKNFERLVRGTEDPYCEWYRVRHLETDVIASLLVSLDGEQVN
jgi:hypothetical protein